MNRTTSFSILAACLAVACGADPDALTGGGGPGNPGGENPGGENTPPGTDPTDPALCAGKEYVGFDQKVLTAGRTVERAGVDRARVKPFTAMRGDYARVLGREPASAAQAASTFGNPPNRWYEEPQSNAVALQTSFVLAFDGCLTLTATDAKYNAAPDATNSPAICTELARKFWSKTPGPQEVQACTEMATTGTALETDARRKWAYACASVLNSAGFLTY